MSIEIQPVTDFPCALGEGPLWHPGEQRLYWTDIDGHRLHSWDPSSGGHQTYDTGCPVGCLGLRRGGGFVLATKRGFALWDLRGPMQIIAHPEAHKPDARFNDGAVDAAGRFWAGTYGASFDSALYRLDPGGAIERMLDAMGNELLDSPTSCRVSSGGNAAETLRVRSRLVSNPKRLVSQVSHYDGMRNELPGRPPPAD
ncbi:MAG: SMP-30/gluconolactonase/LRE family protein, partial [Anaerolineales bacterium]|nr:SMP-30/gluconolactonase/LRE family protein [Anaerolineales bacterium]